MAHVFVGNQGMVDLEVLAAVQGLSDEFWVFAEFDLAGRNIDWAILRQIPDDRPPLANSTVIVTELKRTSATLRGSHEGPWVEVRGDDEREVPQRRREEPNPYWQSVGSANAFQTWLYNNQRQYLDNVLIEREGTEFKAWPNLLILSDPPDLMHRLPLRPTNNFGLYFFDIPSWLRKVGDWRNKNPLQLTAGELARVASALNLTKLPPPASADAFGVGSFDSSGARSDAVGRGDPTWPTWVQGLAQWAADIEARMRRLEQQAEQAEQADRAGQPAATLAPKPPRPEAVTRPLTEDEKRLLLTAIESVRRQNKKRDFPNIFNEMSLHLGMPLRATSFNGYGSARAFMDQALIEGLVVYGPPDANNVPTVYLPDERLPGI